ncbi:DUF397 domain-containing protein [Allosalinactinospora lopnorensis]|uniref:DUF397 domain-containing protein n=1 Tax=Allosalinactinospora lopnorensis TaxID=1352348 RepID=UPI000623D828|nr:DUF397 domain-containing protein [Allosalinactinospora lopnorensis]
MSTESAGLSEESRGGEGGCELTAAGPPARCSPAWHKSGYSAQDRECVEVARSSNGWVLLRDSRHPRDRVIEVSAQAWSIFLRALRRGELD